MASYMKEYAIVCIAIIMLANVAVLKSKCLRKNLFGNIGRLYDMNDENIKKGQKESEEIFSIAIFTSWVSPCTVWSNNFVFKSYFLIVNSLTTLLVHALGIVSVFLLTQYRILLTDLSQFENPPITHCYRNIENNSIR